MNHRTATPLAILFLAATLLAACADTTDTPEAPPEPAETTEVRVFFIQPTDQAAVSDSLTVVMGAEGLDILPAGTMQENSGHMHILIDTDFIAPGQVIPNDAQHLHYGTGALEAELVLTPGPHTLRLQLADGAHIALDGPQYRDEINITVE